MKLRILSLLVIVSVALAPVCLAGSSSKSRIRRNANATIKNQIEQEAKFWKAIDREMKAASASANTNRTDRREKPDEQ